MNPLGSTLCRRLLAIAAIVAAVPSFALNSNIPGQGLPSASTYSTALLPELQGVVSWKTLAQVESVYQGTRMVPQFANDVQRLDAQQVRVQGFAIALQAGGGQRHFLISAVPPECPFCMPAGPEALVEVFAKKPIAYRGEPIIVSGKFELVKDDASGLYYRLTDAELVDTRIK